VGSLELERLESVAESGGVGMLTSQRPLLAFSLGARGIKDGG